jgi:diacylglycerol O-acyltransferase / wax synthase
MGSDASVSTEELPHELVERLAALADEQDGVAEVALSALEEEWLKILIDREIIEPLDLSAEEPEELRLTGLGHRVITACAASRDGGQLDTDEQTPVPVRPAGVPASLTDELVTRLAALWDETDAVAEVALSAQRYGSLASLVAHGIIEPLEDSDGQQGEVTLTAYGREVIRECARLAGIAQSDSMTPYGSALLRRERENTSFQLGAVALFDGDAPPLEELRAHVHARLAAFPLFRQRLAKPLPGPVLERWVDDPTFVVENHVHHVRLSETSRPALQEKVAQIFAQDLDRSRPLWEVWLIEGVPDGFAVLTKTHYALVEGFAGVELLTMLYELIPRGLETLADIDWKPQSMSQLSMVTESVGDAIATAASVSASVIGSVRAPLRTLGQLRTVAGHVGRVAAARLRQAPRSPLNVPVGPERRVELLELPMGDLNAVKDAFGGTVTEVALALLAGALRGWMIARDPLDADVELKVAAIYARDPSDLEPLSARMVPTILSLPTNVGDPVGRLRDMQATSESARRNTEPQSALAAIGRVESTMVLSLLFRFVSARAFNVAVTNLPGSPNALFMLGKQMRALYPLAFLTERHALTVAFTVYKESLCVSLVGDYETLADIDTITSGVSEELQALLAVRPSKRSTARRASLA